MNNEIKNLGLSHLEVSFLRLAVNEYIKKPNSKKSFLISLSDKLSKFASSYGTSTIDK